MLGVYFKTLGGIAEGLKTRPQNVVEDTTNPYLNILTKIHMCIHIYSTEFGEGGEDRKFGDDTYASLPKSMKGLGCPLACIKYLSIPTKIQIYGSNRRAVGAGRVS